MLMPLAGRSRVDESRCHTGYTGHFSLVGTYSRLRLLRVADILLRDVDAPTHAWLTICAQRTGSSLEAVAARRLRDLALRDAVGALATSPTSTAAYVEACEEETHRALAEV
jgi:hypothetical protein